MIKSFIICIILAWGYGLLNIGVKVLEFKDRFFNAKVYDSFSFYKTMSNTVLLHDLVLYLFWFLIVYSVIAAISFFAAISILNRFHFSDRIKSMACYLFLFIVFYAGALVNTVFFPLPHP
jgi:hypothetical protein